MVKLIFKDCQRRTLVSCRSILECLKSLPSAKVLESFSRGRLGRRKNLQDYIPVLAVSLLLCLNFRFSVYGMDFELSGKSIFENFTSDGAPHRKFTGNFSVQKSGAKWVINYSPDGSSVLIITEYDGKDVFCLTRNMVVTPETVGKFPNPTLRFDTSNGVAYASSASISSGPYPFSAPAIPVRFLWFALLSDAVADKPEMKGIEFPAPWGNANSPEARAFRILVKQSTTMPALPDEAEFRASSEFWTAAARGQIRPEQSVSPFPDGSIGGSYKVSQWTNVSNSETTGRFPMICQLERYWPPVKGAKSVIAERSTCQLFNVSLSCSNLGSLEIPDKFIDVFDARFQDTEHPTLSVVYPITNHIWKETNDPLLLRQFGVDRDQYDTIRTNNMRVGPRVAVNNLTPKQRASRRLYAAIFCSIIFLSLPLTLLVRRIRSKPVS